MLVRVRAGLLLLSILNLVQVHPVTVEMWWLNTDSAAFEAYGDDIVGEQLHPRQMGDLDQDGKDEILRLISGRAMILQVTKVPERGNHLPLEETILWQSPADWDVFQAEMTDLDHNGRLEATLLVWRPFKPWPIDHYLPNKGRINNHQNKEGLSCHIIMIGWTVNRYEYKEIWAGSALAHPIRKFAAFDINVDGEEELIVLESNYQDASFAPARYLSAWEWNGFGFSLLARKGGSFHDMIIVENEFSEPIVVTQRSWLVQ